MEKKPTMRKMWYYYKLYLKHMGRSTLYNQYIKPSLKKIRLWSNICKDAEKYREQGLLVEPVTLLTKNGFTFTAGFVVFKYERGYFYLYTPSEDYLVDIKELWNYAKEHYWL